MQVKREGQFLGMTKDVFLKKYGISAVLILMVLILLVISPTFRTTGNMVSILQQVATNGVLALGMVFVITAGGIDLSIGSLLALTSVIIGKILNTTGSAPMAITVAIIACAFFGFLNGYLISKFNMFPFVVTLATQLVIRGVAYIIAAGQSVTLTSRGFRNIGLGKLGGLIPYAIIILMGVFIIAYFILHWTKYGRYVYALGGNVNAAVASGVNVFWTRVGTYVISGVCAGIAGVILTSRINAAQPNIGVGYETDAIAACVIGGTSFAGGVSTIPGTMIGIAIIGVIYNGMNLLKVDSYFQTVAKGALIIGAVLLDMAINKKKQ